AVPELLSSLAASPFRDYYLLAVAAVGAAVWVKVFDVLAAKGVLEQKLSRKLVHTTTGPLFVLTWALFSAAPNARLLAAVVPMLNLARLVAVGSGAWSDSGLVQSVSRSGDRTELLKGPLFYVVTLVAATLLCWRDNPAGLIAVSMMCGGDGLADIVGRRWGGSAKLPYNTAKSWAGSAAMLAGGFGMAYGLITLFCGAGFFTCYPQPALLGCLGAIALASTVVESLPINHILDDNVSVPAMAAALSLLLLPQPVEAVAAVGLAAAATATAGAHVGMVL
ncbi:putative phytol kinase, chloroplastic, partial [Tetrabaena socialis]